MPASDSQQILRDLDKKLWSAADRLGANLDAAFYKHAVLGLIFLKYVSDSFAIRQAEIDALLHDPQSDYFLDPTEYDSADSLADNDPKGGQYVLREFFISLIAQILNPYQARQRPRHVLRRFFLQSKRGNGLPKGAIWI